MRGEDATYDQLSRSADGPLLETLYTQVRQSMIMQQQGGAIATVREVKTLGGAKEPASLSDERAFRYRLSWSVEGDVEHWGHVHTRANRYDATFTVQPRDDRWLFTELELLHEERLPSATTLRGAERRGANVASPKADAVKPETTPADANSSKTTASKLTL